MKNKLVNIAREVSYIKDIKKIQAHLAVINLTIKDLHKKLEKDITQLENKKNKPQIYLDYLTQYY